MKAIQIFDVNRELIEAWGEKEELTWDNSFGFVLGSVLVVDDDLPQGYAVKTNSRFDDEYMWKTNFGTYGWSEIERVADVADVREPDPEFIYIVWDMNAESWVGSKTMTTIHKTLDGAIQAIPENLRGDEMKRDAYDPYVANYGYYAVEKRPLKD